MPIRTSSITGRRSFSTSSRAFRELPTSRPTRRMPDRCSTSRSTARWRRASASCPRPSTTRSTTPSASASSRPCTPSLNQYHVVLEVDPRFQSRPGGAQRHLREFIQRPGGAAQYPRRQHDQGGADRHQSSGHVPVDDHLVQSEARRGAWRRGRRHHRSSGRAASPRRWSRPSRATPTLSSPRWPASRSDPRRR